MSRLDWQLAASPTSIDESGTDYLYWADCRPIRSAEVDPQQPRFERRADIDKSTTRRVDSPCAVPCTSKRRARIGQHEADCLLMEPLDVLAANLAEII